jgi:hypothetical protein
MNPSNWSRYVIDSNILIQKYLHYPQPAGVTLCEILGFHCGKDLAYILFDYDNM